MKTLNIKNPEAYRLAESLSKTTGKSMTHVVTEALRDQLTRLQERQKRAGLDELLAIANRISSNVQRPYVDHASLLYDENGLPR